MLRTNRKAPSIAVLAAIATFLLCLIPVPKATAEEVAAASFSPYGLAFDILVPNEGSTLTVTGAGKYTSTAFFDLGEAVTFSVVDSEGIPAPDGAYSYELRIVPELDPATREELAAAREAGDTTIVERFCAEGRIPEETAVLSGAFTVANSQILDPTLEEEDSGSSLRTVSSTPALAGGAAGEVFDFDRISGEDQFFFDQLVALFGICVGAKCTNGENLGWDAVRLKDYKLRLDFSDTSQGSFPKTRWQLSANDLYNGGAEKFSIDDVTNSRTPFTVRAKAPDNALYVDAEGRIGLGTATPIAKIHAVASSDPALRLEQDSGAGVRPQIWDLVGNEIEFFLRDANKITKPFRVRKGAPSGSLQIAENGNVGVGVGFPAASLHVGRGNGQAAVLVEEAGDDEGARALMTLRNNGRVIFQMEDTSADGKIWKLRTVEGQLNIDTDAGAGNELTLTQTGNLTILGMLTQNSNREAKNNIEAVDPTEVLEKVAQLPLSTWTYKKDQEVEHLGPMAQDFYDAFGLGASNTGITTYDTAGVALASVQALYQRLQEQERLNADLQARLEALERNR